MENKIKINDLIFELYDTDSNTFLVKAGDRSITLSGDKLREYIVRGFSQNLRSLLKIGF